MEMPTPSPDAILRVSVLLALWLLCLNAATWALAGIDRRRWAFGGRRLSETAFLWLALLGGWPGLLYGLRESRRLRVRYHYTFHGWLRSAIMTQAVFAALALMPQGVLEVATEAVASLVMPEASASERDTRPERLLLDSQRGRIAITGVVTLSANP